MSGQLVDGSGRSVEYLRLSVTDRCNLSCAYCRPVTDVRKPNPCDMLSLKDMLRLVRVFARLGIRKIRVTGGEPLTRKGIINFIEQVARTEGIERVALTTNGILMRSMSASLVSAGVKNVNISLDTMSRDKYARLTGRQGLGDVMRGIKAALRAGFESVKINMVAIRGVNSDEVMKFARLSTGINAQIRFIELMPASGDYWNEDKFIPASEIKRNITPLGPLLRVESRPWSGPAEVYRLEGAKGELGFISAMSRHFCGACNRMRLTSGGKLLTCLFGGTALDIGQMIRSGADDEDIASAVLPALLEKNSSHGGANGDSALKPRMIGVGG
ncbi:MAG: GTP 3',8-cyclase MoaA [Nitrospinae bacterium]|nr:GTP 3',8-cyclase MoaA [Nitrospinota bacterium]